MALIDQSYFFGSLTLPLSDTDAGVSGFNVFLNEYEKKLLTSLFGYELNKAFQAGLLIDPIADRWNDLLYGKEYTFESRLKKWDGLIMLGDGVSATINNKNFIEVEVGRGGEFDPVTESVSTTIPVDFVGASFILHKRGTGPLKANEYSVSGNTLTLATGYTFAEGDTYFYQKEISVSISAESGLVPQSPIANFVYYHWMRNNASFSTASGEKTIKNPTAVNTTPVVKMVDAWNEMAGWNKKLVEFLYVNLVTYPEFKSYYNNDCDWHEFISLKNRFGV